MECPRHGIKMNIVSSLDLLGCPWFWFRCNHITHPCLSPKAGTVEEARLKGVEWVIEAASLTPTEAPDD